MDKPFAVDIRQRLGDRDPYFDGATGGQPARLAQHRGQAAAGREFRHQVRTVICGEAVIENPHDIPVFELPRRGHLGAKARQPCVGIGIGARTQQLNDDGPARPEIVGQVDGGEGAAAKNRPDHVPVRYRIERLRVPFRNLLGFHA